MVHVGEMRDELSKSLQSHIRRIYPVIRGPNRWGQLVDNRKIYFDAKGEFPLVQEPLIEAIPQYATVKGSAPKDMPNWKHIGTENNFNDNDIKRMKLFGSILETAGKDFNLYPHQKESIIAHLEGRDVVVATGTGSGKTEAFLFPAVNHLVGEAIRCKGKKSSRGVKVMVLYPMNALVSDQMSRIRDLLGNPEVATQLQNSGYGRFPQFGMYTSRTPFPGFYAEPDNKDEWRRESTNKRMEKYIQPYIDSAKDERLWNSLREKGKIPSIGGKITFADENMNENKTISFSDLPPNIRSTIIKKDKREGRSIEEVKSSRFVLEEKKQVFDRFKGQDKKLDNSIHLKYLGDGLDREIISRHQMHLGGVRQYIKSKYPDANPSEIINDLNIGIPDILVTNYSMLEYMLMRPLEHIFWHETTKWLEEDEDAKLLLVIDEAHLYEGSAGTEFSLLLNRLLSVIMPEAVDMVKAREKIQFIMTSASLGNDEQKAREYATGLLTLSPERESKLHIPKSTQIEFPIVPGEDEKIGETLSDIFHTAATRISQGDPRSEVEDNVIEHIANTIRINEITIKSGNTYDEVRKNRIFEIISNWPAAHRLRRILLDRKSLTDMQKIHMSESYDKFELDIPDDKNNRLPVRYGILKNFLFSNPNQSDQAMDFMLDLIASAKKYGEKIPFLPIRMHLFLRGDTKSRICPKCGKIYPDGQIRCICDALVYDLILDRNCGGTYIRLWWKSSGFSNPGVISSDNYPDFSLFDLSNSRVWQTRNRDPDNNVDSYQGILAQVLDDDDLSLNENNPGEKFALLNVIEGSILAIDNNLLNNEDYVVIRIVENKTNQKKREWEKNGGFIEPRVCNYCNRDYTHNKTTPQYSDTQTRGNEFFNSLISRCTSKLDPIPNSLHAHEGRKMLVFSDSKQKAARLARDIKKSQAVDQGRAMFVQLHHSEWFKSIPEKHRSISNLYPYLCLLSAKVRTNPLSDTEFQPDSSRMMSHTNQLLIYLYNIYKNEIGALNYLTNDLPSINFNEQFEKHAKKSLLFALKTDHFLWKLQLEKEYESEKWAKGIGKLENALKNAREQLNLDWTISIKNTDPLFYIIPEVEDTTKIKEYNELIEISDSTTLCEFKHFNKMHVKLKKVIEDESYHQYLVPIFLRDAIIDDSEIYIINLMQEISGRILYLLENTLIDNIKFSERIRDWNINCLSLDNFDNPPDNLCSMLLRWICDERFGTSSLGLGNLKIIDEFGPSGDQKSEMNWDLMKHALPLLFIDQRKLSMTVAGYSATTSRAIACDIKNDKRNTKFPKHESKFKSYINRPSDTISMKDMTFSNQSIAKQFVTIILGSNKDNHPKLMQRQSEITKFLIWLESNLHDRDNSILHQTGDLKKLYLSADTIVFEPLTMVEGEIKSNGQFCKTCLSRRSPSHVKYGISCPECDSDSSQVIDLTSEVNEKLKSAAIDYYSERLLPWYELSNTKNKTLAVYRAEEHTAQISEFANTEDAYTKAELHELLFMDIPVEMYVADDGKKYEQPPIDILSCTTTMEVGIDLGDLNAVALRNVPPQPSNYQQRVGRAGRGSSEVSLAVTWIDNTAYAQEFFTNPEKLVTNPSKSPILYLKNRKIRQRHMNAILFQRFFKEPEYLPEELLFNGMDYEKNGINLLKRLGKIEDYIKNER